MARLLLHIGAHKTATSYVQRLFHTNRHLLADHGILYPDIGPNRAHHILVTPWISVPEIPEASFGRKTLSQRLLGKSLPDSFFEDFVRKHARQKGTVFLSAEIFSRAEPQSVDMKDLARRLAPFEDVRIVYTVRHQADYIQSIWLQVAKSGKAPRFDQFLANALDRKMASGLWVDHGKVIDHVLTGFSPDQLIVLDYETIRRHPEGMAGPFLGLMDSTLRFHDLKDIDRREANISPDPLATWLAHAIRWPSPVKPGLVRNLQLSLDLIRERHGKKRTTLYAREEYERVGTVFAEANAGLARWLQTGQPGARLSAPALPENLLFREELTIPDWTALARQAALPDWGVLARQAGIDFENS